MTEAVLITATFPLDFDVAGLMATLVEQRLLACATIGAPATSIYLWEGVVQRELETLVLMKTSAACAEGLMAAVKARHPYATPCLLITPITGGAEEYLAWIAAQTGPEPQKGPSETL